MKTTMNNFAMVSTWIRTGIIALVLAAPCLSLSAGCSQVEGSRCNPALSHDECDNSPTVQCYQPSLTMYPACNGEAYCCVLNASGAIMSTEPNCQFLVMCQAMGTGDGGVTPDAGAPETGTEASTTPEASTPDATMDTGVVDASGDGP